MKKILFLIHDLGPGGAEKVLVNLVNNLDKEKFDITVMSLFGGGVNQKYLAPHIRCINCFPKPIRGNIHLMKLMSPDKLHRLLIKEKYDIEIAYLEGPSARIISGCPSPNTILISWIHIELRDQKDIAASFRNIQEAKCCYNRFNKIVCVSDSVRKAFQNSLNVQKPHVVLYNTNESELIRLLSKQTDTQELIDDNCLRLIGVGKILKSKGFDRLARIHVRLKEEGYPIHTYILGEGREKKAIEKFLQKKDCENSFTFLGYQDNPYKYVSKCDLFVCASFFEGYSTAATEALIVGTPVCTVKVAGMCELLGVNNEYGIIVDNDEESLYQGLKTLLDDRTLLSYYRKQAAVRGHFFNTVKTVMEVEKMLLNM